MSLGLIGEYGSDSESESESTVGQNQVSEKKQNEACFDPLGINSSLDNVDTTSSSDSERSEESDKDSPDGEELLPHPDLDALPGTASVFVNPYQEAEQAKLSILKHHVSELAPELKKEGKKFKKFSKHKAKFKGQRDPSDEDGGEGVVGKRKVRCGVGDGLKPAKKFMKIHTQIQAKERPWTRDSRPQ